MLFPDTSQHSMEFNYFDKIKQRAILIGETFVRRTKEQQEQLDEIDAWLRSQIKPKDINESERGYEQRFEELCLLIQPKTTKLVKILTVVEFHTLVNLIKKKKL